MKEIVVERKVIKWGRVLSLFLFLLVIWAFGIFFALVLFFPSATHEAMFNSKLVSVSLIYSVIGIVVLFFEDDEKKIFYVPKRERMVVVDSKKG